MRKYFFRQKKLLVGKYIARIGMEGSVKSSGRDVILSPYTTGLLDKFLDGNSIPAFETARGCPFLCTFCDQGLDASKITSFSSKRLLEEFWYVGEKMSKLENGTKTVAVLTLTGVYLKKMWSLPGMYLKL